MSSITFDTLKLAQRLEAAGFPPKQAADTAQALAESLGEVPTLATKADVEQATAELKVLIAESKADILKWMFTSLFAQAAVIVALLKLLWPHPPARGPPLPRGQGVSSRSCQRASPAARRPHPPAYAGPSLSREGRGEDRGLL